jgi:PKD repeat protein
VDTITVTVGTHPVVNLGNDTCLGSGGSTVLNAGSGYTRYIWSTGASTQTITANHSGTYWVQVTNAAGCTGSDTIIVGTGVSVSLGKDTCVTTGSSIVLSTDSAFSSYLWNTGASTRTITVTTAGTYAVTVTNAGGCQAHDTVIVATCGNSHPTGCKPLAYFRVLSISGNNTVIFKDSSINATTSLWTFGDSSTSNLSGTLVHTYAVGGIYTVKLVVCDSCGCDSITERINVNATGIVEIKGLEAVSLYPNPTSNICTVDITATEDMDMSVSVVDMIGAVVQNDKWQLHSGDNKHNLDLTGAASGMYQVTLTSGSGTMTRKLNIIK